MTLDNKSTSPDDEYQFPKDEYVSMDSESVSHTDDAHLDDAAAGTATEKMSRGSSFGAHFIRYISQLKNKRIIIVIALVIVVIIAFRIINSKETSKPVVPQQSVTVQQPVQQPAEQPMALPQPVSNDNSEVGALKSQLKDLQIQMTDMQNSLTQSQSDNQTLQQSVSALSVKVGTLSTALNKVLEKQPSHGSRIVFHLRAVVPDRAWIIANTGKTMSVTVGNHIKGYGTVSSIDSQNGVVDTSSGRKIEYGPNDY